MRLDIPDSRLKPIKKVVKCHKNKKSKRKKWFDAIYKEAAAMYRGVTCLS